MLTRLKLLQHLEQYWTAIAIAGLLIILYAPLVVYWYDGWLNKAISIEHEYYSHGLIGLPFAAYLAWQTRRAWQELPNKPNVIGLVLIVLGVCLYLSSLADAMNLSFPLVLTGLCLWFKGHRGVQCYGFPLLLVVLATPTQIPYLIAPYTLLLQQFIAGTAGFILLQFGLDVRVDQIYLYVNDRIVEVAPYCAGLKMLFTSLYVGLMLSYWTGAWVSRLKTGSFFVGIVFVSVSANIIRNTLLTFFHGTGQDQAFDWLHEGWGGDLYSTCMLGLLVVLLKAIERWVDSSPSPEREVIP
jgi:cyanoexosortase B